MEGSRKCLIVSNVVFVLTTIIFAVVSLMLKLNLDHVTVWTVVATSDNYHGTVAVSEERANQVCWGAQLAAKGKEAMKACE